MTGAGGIAVAMAVGVNDHARGDRVLPPAGHRHTRSRIIRASEARSEGVAVADPEEVAVSNHSSTGRTGPSPTEEAASARSGRLLETPVSDGLSRTCTACTPCRIATALPGPNNEPRRPRSRPAPASSRSPGIPTAGRLRRRHGTGRGTSRNRAAPSRPAPSAPCCTHPAAATPEPVSPAVVRTCADSSPSHQIASRAAWPFVHPPQRRILPGALPASPPD
jgi:hypothetical protein